MPHFYSNCLLRVPILDFLISLPLLKRAVIVAHLVERSLPKPNVCGSNPVISKIYLEQVFAVNCIEKTKTEKKKDPGNGPFFPLLKACHLVRLTLVKSGKEDSNKCHSLQM